MLRATILFFSQCRIVATYPEPSRRIASPNSKTALSLVVGFAYSFTQYDIRIHHQAQLIRDICTALIKNMKKGRKRMLTALIFETSFCYGITIRL